MFTRRPRGHRRHCSQQGDGFPARSLLSRPDRESAQGHHRIGIRRPRGGRLDADRRHAEHSGHQCGPYRNLRYHPTRSLAPISPISAAPNVVVVALAKQRNADGQPFSFGSGGSGTAAHLGAEVLKRVAGINMVHIPPSRNVAGHDGCAGGAR
jgi:hypothetical protein